jgi:Ser-tRNA(Ala) deacylase AlaX
MELLSSMGNPLYLSDSYSRTCKANVIAIKDGKQVFLDQSVFYPRSGGQACDFGKLARGGEEFAVVAVSKTPDGIMHEVSREGLVVGDEVECQIDWARRHRLMRMHTAGHVLASIMFKAGGILITGNQLDIDKSRFDFSMENFDRQAFQALVDKANAQLARNLDVEVSFLPREEALKVEGAVKLAVALPPEIKELRMVKIGDVDYQADGGTHVRNTSEVGKIILLGAENKGKSNRRIYYALEP